MPLRGRAVSEMTVIQNLVMVGNDDAQTCERRDMARSRSLLLVIKKFVFMFMFALW